MKIEFQEKGQNVFERNKHKKIEWQEIRQNAHEVSYQKITKSQRKDKSMYN